MKLKNLLFLLVMITIIFTSVKSKINSFDKNTDINLSMLNSAMAQDENGGNVKTDHISDIDQCVYKCTVIDVLGYKVTYEVDGSLTECHYSRDFNCEEKPCKPTNGCWIWN